MGKVRGNVVHRQKPSLPLATPLPLIALALSKRRAGLALGFAVHVPIMTALFAPLRAQMVRAQMVRVVTVLEVRVRAEKAAARAQTAKGETDKDAAGNKLKSAMLS